MPKFSFATGFWFVAFLVVAVMLVGNYRGANVMQVSTKYIFENKVFSDNQYDKLSNVPALLKPYAQVYITGTLTGDGIGYKDNTVAVTCNKNTMECLTNEIDGISSNQCQLSRLDTPKSFPITTWNDSEIVASNNGVGCWKTTITIDRGLQSALWVQEPINQTQPQCKDSENKTYKWEISDPTWALSLKKN